MRRIAVATALAVLVLVEAPIAASSEARRTAVVAAVLTGDTGVVNLEAHASGQEELTGTGVGFHRDFRSRANFVLKGRVEGETLDLSGTVSKAGAPCLLGTAVTVVADTLTGAVSHTLGPISCPGPFYGEVLTFQGAGRVVLTG